MKTKQAGNIIFAALAVILLACACVAKDMPEEKISLPQLGAAVTVKYGQYGIPSIYAKSLHDLFFAQGYIHARDRLWQMDINRRRATGRMAELFGKGSVGEDYNAYIARLPQVSKQVWAECLPQECEAFRAYADGVNAYIAGLKEYPEEYVKIGAVPQPWDPVDSIAIGRGMSWALSSDVGIEVAVGVIAQFMGAATVMKFIPMDGLDPITIVPADASSSFPADAFDARVASNLDDTFFQTTMSIFGPSRGSNNWVVAGSRSASGAPLLSNDTHMGLSNPCDWYEIQLKAPGLHVSGLSVPGAPGILQGYNERVAWGETQARFDVSDVYVEKLDPAKPDTNYIFKGESRPFDVEKILIKYKTDAGMETEERTILSTVHGPVVYDKDKPRTVMSYRWTGHDPTHESMAFLGFMNAKNLDDFKAALDHFEIGAQNFVYADVDGNIYYRSQGKVPIRNGRAFMPLDGASGKYEWTGYIPFAELPHLENPKQGYVVTANNRMAGKDYPYYVGTYFDKGYRARRITDLILQTDKMTVDGMQRIQADVYSMPAKNMLPILFAAAKGDPPLLTADGTAALDILSKWDLYEKKESIAPSVFYTWLKHCALNSLKGKFPDEALGNISRPEVFYPMLLGNKKLPIDIFDDPKTADVHETKEMVMLKSLNDAAAELSQRFGADSSQWTWDKLHKVTLGHQLGGEFNIGPFASDGGSDSVNVADFGLLGGDFNFGHGPNMRVTVEMLPTGPRGFSVIAGGESDRRGDPHSSDEFQMWLKYQTHPMPFDDGSSNDGVESVTVLGP